VPDEVFDAWFLNLQRRDAMANENVRDTRPTGTIVAILSLAWWADIAAAKNGSILQVHHPEHGWLVFVFPPESANKLGGRSSGNPRGVIISRGRFRQRRWLPITLDIQGLPGMVSKRQGRTYNIKSTL
jgi:hypothetical protein